MRRDIVAGLQISIFMNKGNLSAHFEGVAAKRLSAVEADILTSNQHEFNGVRLLRSILGEPEGKVFIPAKVLYLCDTEEPLVPEEATFTWYDSRAGERARGGDKHGRMRWEYRLYFPDTQATSRAIEGDLLIIAKCRDGSLLVLIAASTSNSARQLEWLFGFSELADAGFEIREAFEREKDNLQFTSRLILESIGIELQVEPEAEDFLDEILKKFGAAFPTTRAFSTFARSTLKDVSARDDQDKALMAWMEREEILFRALERHLIADRLSKGFGSDASGVDVDGFLSFSLSVQNRRKSRVGLALENHLEFLFAECGIHYTRTAVTENKAKPDFIFPSIAQYRDGTFSADRLTMLGVKSTCKDRWRQVLAEADRIGMKHLLTLEAAISKHQTDEMAAKHLQLVLPRGLHDSYTPDQQLWLMDIAQFTELLKSRQ